MNKKIAIRRGAALTRLLQSRDLTREDFGKALEGYGFNAGYGAVSKWATGANGMPLDDPDFLEATAKILNLSPLSLLIEFEILPVDTIRAALNLSAVDMELIQLWHRGDFEKLVTMIARGIQ